MNLSGLPYRRGVIGIIRNKKDKFLIVQMVGYNENEWRFPGGGIENGETPEEAIMRELKEELGTDNFILVKRSSILNRYDWSDEVIKMQYKKRGEYYRGQEQIQFLLEFLGCDSEIKFNANELKQIKWVGKDDLNKYFSFRGQYEMTMKVFQEFGL